MQALHELAAGPGGPSDAIHSMHYWAPEAGGAAQGPQLVSGLADGTFVRWAA